MWWGVEGVVVGIGGSCGGEWVRSKCGEYYENGYATIVFIISVPFALHNIINVSIAYHIIRLNVRTLYDLYRIAYNASVDGALFATTCTWSAMLYCVTG